MFNTFNIPTAIFFHLRYKKDSLMSPQLHFKIFIIKTIKIICFKNQMLEE